MTLPFNLCLVLKSVFDLMVLEKIKNGLFKPAVD